MADTYVITGKTFDHRDVLKRLGARWDASAKRWEVEKLSQASVDHLRSLPGLFVAVIEKPAPDPVAYDWGNDDGDDADELIAVTLPKGVERTVPTWRSAIYGDDPTYHNTFADQNPRAFFGFSSLAKFVEYMEDLRPGSHFGPGYEKGDAGWSGTETMQEALTLAREGWQEGAELAEAFSERLALERPRQRRRKAAVAGGRVNVGRMLSGDPAHMVTRPKQPGRKVVTFFVEAGCNGGVRGPSMLLRAAGIAAMCDLMENAGYSCTVVATDTATHGGFAIYQLAVTVKEAGERLNLADIVFALGHPAFLRRLSFGATTSVSHTKSIWGHMGSASNAFDTLHPCGKSEFYVPVFEPGNQAALTADPLSVMKYVKPDNLPIEF